MKKIMLAVLVLSLGNWLWCDLQEHYKKGEIILKGIESFGQGNDWEELFYDPYKDMVVAPDGSIFVANDRKHNIFKFDKQGKLVKTFGRRGVGPGDFVHPGDLGILDKKYLVVGEYASNRRFSLWNLDGKHINVVRTKTSVFQLTALRGNRVAYYCYNQYAQKKNDYQSVVSIVIKDITSGTEKIMKQVTLLNRSSIKFGQHGSANYGNFFAEVFLAQTINGNLAVGVSNQPNIDIFSPTGKLIHSFDLKMVPILVSKAYIKEFKYKVIARVKKKAEATANPSLIDTYNQVQKALKKLDFSTLFDKHLPLYNEILVDSEGNFLVFKFTECQKNCTPLFRVYSKEGKFICETRLNKGKYELDIDRSFRKIRFTSEGIFALLMNRGDEDEIIRLIKSNYPPAP